MKILKVVPLFGIALVLASCSGHKADGKQDMKKDTTVTYEDSVRASAGTPPADSTMADSTTNAPKMSGQ